MSNTLKLGNGKWATGKDTLLSFSDTNNNYKPLPFSFSRASSGTVINKDGLIETVGAGEPRIDFKDNTKGALLLEPQRSNLVTYSENLNGSGWSNTGATITENQSISPDGSLNADLIELDSNLDRLAAVFGSTGGTYTFSFYIKAKEGESGVWRTRVNGDSTLWQNTQVNDTEWTRVTQTFTKTGSGNIVVYPAYRVDGTSTLFNAYIYGAQLEQGSYATSYIPTSGQANGVTRVADSSSQTVPDSVIGQTEGTVFLDFKPQTLDGTSRYLSIENSNSVGSGWMGVFASLVSGTIRFRFYGDGWDIDSSLIIEKDTRYKIAFSYKNGVQTSIYVNGNLLNNITASLSGKSYQKIRLSEAAIGVRGDADFKDIKLYDARLTDQELIALTS